MDWLGQLIDHEYNDKYWHPVKVSRNGPNFSHLFFADDLMLFAKANLVNCGAVRQVLDTFCQKSGQTISQAKSKVYFSPNVEREARENLCDIQGFHSTSSISKYLGIPIKTSSSSTQDFNFVLDRVKKKLAGWEANLLSMAGRSVLVQASLSTIPIYTMQCSFLLGKVLDQIDKVNHNFLWGSSETSKKVH